MFYVIKMVFNGGVEGMVYIVMCENDSQFIFSVLCIYVLLGNYVYCLYFCSLGVGCGFFVSQFIMVYQFLLSDYIGNIFFE